MLIVPAAALSIVQQSTPPKRRMAEGASSYFAGMVAGAGEPACDSDTTEAVDKFTTQVWELKNLALSHFRAVSIRVKYS